MDELKLFGDQKKLEKERDLLVYQGTISAEQVSYKDYAERLANDEMRVTGHTQYQNYLSQVVSQSVGVVIPKAGVSAGVEFHKGKNEGLSAGKRKVRKYNVFSELYKKNKNQKAALKIREESNDSATKIATPKQYSTEDIKTSIDDMMVIDTSKFAIASDADFISSAPALGNISKKVKEIRQIKEKNPEFFANEMTAEQKALFDKKFDALEKLSLYYEARCELIADPYYASHFNTELSFRGGQDDVEDKAGYDRVSAKLRLVRALSQKMSSYNIGASTGNTAPFSSELVQKAKPGVLAPAKNAVSKDVDFSKIDRKGIISSLEQEGNGDTTVWGKAMKFSLSADGKYSDALVFEGSLTYLFNMRGVVEMGADALMQTLNKLASDKMEDRIEGAKSFKTVVKKQMEFVERKYGNKLLMMGADELIKHQDELGVDLGSITTLFNFMQKISVNADVMGDDGAQLLSATGYYKMCMDNIRQALSSITGGTMASQEQYDYAMTDAHVKSVMEHKSVNHVHDTKEKVSWGEKPVDGEYHASNLTDATADSVLQRMKALLKKKDASQIKWNELFAEFETLSEEQAAEQLKASALRDYGPEILDGFIGDNTSEYMSWNDEAESWVCQAYFGHVAGTGVEDRDREIAKRLTVYRNPTAANRAMLGLEDDADFADFMRYNDSIISAIRDNLPLICAFKTWDNLYQMLTKFSAGDIDQAQKKILYRISDQLYENCEKVKSEYYSLAEPRMKEGFDGLKEMYATGRLLQTQGAREVVFGEKDKESVVERETKTIPADRYITFDGIQYRSFNVGFKEGDFSLVSLLANQKFRDDMTPEQRQEAKDAIAKYSDALAKYKVLFGLLRTSSPLLAGKKDKLCIANQTQIYVEANINRELGELKRKIQEFIIQDKEVNLSGSAVEVLREKIRCHTDVADQEHFQRAFSALTNKEYGDAKILLMKNKIEKGDSIAVFADLIWFAENKNLVEKGNETREKDKKLTVTPIVESLVESGIKYLSEGVKNKDELFIAIFRCERGISDIAFSQYLAHKNNAPEGVDPEAYARFAVANSVMMQRHKAMESFFKMMEGTPFYEEYRQFRDSIVIPEDDLIGKYDWDREVAPVEGLSEEMREKLCTYEKTEISTIQKASIYRAFTDYKHVDLWASIYRLGEESRRSDKISPSTDLDNTVRHLESTLSPRSKITEAQAAARNLMEWIEKESPKNEETRMWMDKFTEPINRILSIKSE